MSKSSLPKTTARERPENIAILLREPFRALSDELIERLAASGHGEVRYAHGTVLQFLDDAGTRVSVLAARAQMTKQSMAQLVAHLEAHGYVERVPDPADGRAKLVRATARGREVYALVREYIAELDARLDERLGEPRCARLRALLEELGAAVASRDLMAKTIYTAKATVTGGRAEGHGVTDDGALDVQLRTPDVGGGTNPEQLFAVGYAACFEGAIGVLGRRERGRGGRCLDREPGVTDPTEERGSSSAWCSTSRSRRSRTRRWRSASCAARTWCARTPTPRAGTSTLRSASTGGAWSKDPRRRADLLWTMALRTWRPERWLFAAALVCLGAVVLRNLGVVPPRLQSVWEYAYNGAELLATAICALRAYARPGANARRGRPSRSACWASPPVTSTGRRRSPTTPRRRTRRSPTPAT